MKITLNKSFGEIQIESTDDKDAIAQASFWGELPDLCPLCKASLYLHFRITKEGDYKYYELYCRGVPKHFTQFGQYKTGGLFYKADSWAEHTFGGAAAERDAEISRYNDAPEESPEIIRKSLIADIQKGVAAIESRGVKTEQVNLGAMDLTELRGELDALRRQYARLVNRKAA